MPCKYVSGETEELIGDISISDLCKEGGYKKVLNALGQKYSKRKEEEMQHYILERMLLPAHNTTERNVSTIRGPPGNQLQETRKARNGPSVSSHSWMLMKKMNLDMTQEALILTSTSGSLIGMRT